MVSLRRPHRGANDTFKLLQTIKLVVGGKIKAERRIYEKNAALKN
jgi:hypothetical protein